MNKYFIIIIIKISFYIIKFIIKKSNYNNKNKYYVISKDFGDLNDPVLELTEKHLHPFEDYTSFCNTCDSLGISIPSSWK